MSMSHLPQSGEAPLVDSFGRVHTSMRISVTDRCNIRCFYCMPDEQIRFKPRDEILSHEEIQRFVEAILPLGINQFRITGGEPLVRNNLPGLIQRIAALPGVDDLAMTTNGVLLAGMAEDLCKAGLQRLNISLDGLQEETFRRITRREGLQKVLEGIEAAQKLPFRQIRLNAVAIRGITEAEIIPLGKFAREQGLELRFIEFMPLDAEEGWESRQVLDGDEIKRTLESAFGPLVPRPRPNASQPAVDFEFADGCGRIGFINPVTQPFCSDCNRLRITAEGQMRNCLFSTKEWDARELLRSGATSAEIRELLRECVMHKKAGHGIDSSDFQRPERAMYQIGG